MKIYAVRDRLIDYFMQPFIGPDDKNVLASVARLINQGEVTSDIAQAPHQFEVWKLGEIGEDGHITAEKAYLADCSSLIRPGIRERGAGPGGPAQGETHQDGNPARGAGGNTGTESRPISHHAPTKDEATAEVPRGPRGGYPPRGDS